MPVSLRCGAVGLRVGARSEIGAAPASRRIAGPPGRTWADFGNLRGRKAIAEDAGHGYDTIKENSRSQHSRSPPEFD